MVRLNLTASATYVLDQLWIPESVFNYEISGNIERNQDTDVTLLYSDGLPLPSTIVFNTRRYFVTPQQLRYYVTSIQAILDDVLTIEYYGLIRSVNKAVLNWNFGSEGTNYLEASLVLYPSGDWTEI